MIQRGDTGDTVRLSCGATKYYNGKTIWFYSIVDHNQPKFSVVGNSSTLVIPKVSMNNEGYYYCYREYIIKEDMFISIRKSIIKTRLLIYGNSEVTLTHTIK